MAKTTQGDFLNACDKLLVAATANAGQPVVDELRGELEKKAGGAKEAQARRNLHRYQAQQASRDLEGYLEDAKAIYSRLRHLLIGIFGHEAEKLVEFGFKPFRGPQASTERKVQLFLEKEKEKEKASGNGQSPARAAHLQTESTT